MDVNGAAYKILIFKPFEEAFAVTKKILFQPFDLKKWFVIGFAAWLSKVGFGAGGNYRYNSSDWRDVPWLQNISDTLHGIPFWIAISGLIALMVLVFGLAILL